MSNIQTILTDMIQVGIAIGAGEELDKDKEWHLERAEQQIEYFYRNKILEARKDEVERIPYWGTPYDTEVFGYEKLFKEIRLKDIATQFNSIGDNDE